MNPIAMQIHVQQTINTQCFYPELSFWVTCSHTFRIHLQGNQYSYKQSKACTQIMWWIFFLAIPLAEGRLPFYMYIPKHIKSYIWRLRYFRSSVQVNRQCSLEYHGFMYVLTQSRSQSLLSSYSTCSMKMKALERSNPKVILIGYLKCNTIQ